MEFEKGSEPTSLLKEIVSVLKIVNDDPVSTIYSNSDAKRFFFEEYVGGITKRIS